MEDEKRRSKKEGKKEEKEKMKQKTDSFPLLHRTLLIAA